jgi:hypothetical protein
MSEYCLGCQAQAAQIAALEAEVGRLQGEIANLVRFGGNMPKTDLAPYLALAIAAQKAVRRNIHALACRITDMDDCDCGALPGGKTAIAELSLALAHPAVQRGIKGE